MQLSDFSFIVDKIQSGAICVLPTDTVYGLIASTEQPETIERLYDIKGRVSDKPFIILISDILQLKTFSIEITDEQIKTLQHLWPGPVSVILECEDEVFRYLHRGHNSLAFRLPNQVWLQELIDKTGPIIATSANKSGQPISNDINRIIQQLPDVDFYIEGPTGDKPSKLARLADDGEIEWVKRKI